MLLLVVASSLLLVTAPGRANVAHGLVSHSSSAHAIQDPTEAENYRKLAAAKRKAAENVPAKRECYLAWARYYDCLADKLESGDNRDCGKEPDDC